MIKYFNRVSKQIEVEKVYGNDFLEWAYQGRLGFALTDKIFSKKWLSLLMGAYESSSFSKNKIPGFIERYDINMGDYEDATYGSFNDFFIRRFKPGKRPFAASPTAFCAGAEARYLAFENLSAQTKVKVKGIDIDLKQLVGNDELGEAFDGGTLIIARLCPVDYHRFHFPISGQISQAYRVAGDLHSVNPVALGAKSDVFLVNERQVSMLESPQFGKVAMIEVGALGVGKIIQSAYSLNGAYPVKFDKGQEKGYFLFGGSTVIWVIQRNRLILSEDLRTNSLQGLETWIPLGDPLGEFGDSKQ
jgi:phosphatidylserine decarboxylase